MGAAGPDITACCGMSTAPLRCLLPRIHAARTQASRQHRAPGESTRQRRDMHEGAGTGRGPSGGSWGECYEGSWGWGKRWLHWWLTAVLKLIRLAQAHWATQNAFCGGSGWTLLRASSCCAALGAADAWTPEGRQATSATAHVPNTAAGLQQARPGPWRRRGGSARPNSCMPHHDSVHAAGESQVLSIRQRLGPRADLKAAAHPVLC